MLFFFPWLAWIAALTSATLLIVMWTLGELAPRALAALGGCFLLAAYCQLFSASALVGAFGLLLQTLLAIFLILRWKWRA